LRRKYFKVCIGNIFKQKVHSFISIVSRAICFLVVLLIALISVSFQVINAANKNPDVKLL